MLDLDGLFDDESDFLFEEPIFPDDDFSDPLELEGDDGPDPEEDEVWEDDWVDDDDDTYLTDDEFDSIVNWDQT